MFPSVEKYVKQIQPHITLFTFGKAEGGLQTLLCIIWLFFDSFTKWKYSWSAWRVFKNWKRNKKFWWLILRVVTNSDFLQSKPNKGFLQSKTAVRRKQRFSENTVTHLHARFASSDKRGSVEGNPQLKHSFSKSKFRCLLLGEGVPRF